MVIESNAHWVTAGVSTEDLIVRGYELAKQLDLHISAHIAGGTFSLEMGFLKYLRETGRTDVRYLMQLGILDPRWILIHCIHCTELDIEHMARVGASLVYTPTSESIRGGGIGPIERAARGRQRLARHRRTDGRLFGRHGRADEGLRADAACAPSRSDPHIGRARDRDGDHQCRQGAGLQREIGSLEAGKRADIAVFDLDKPYVGVLHRPISTFICAGKGSDARAVLVDGKIVYHDGKFARLPMSPG